MNENSILKKLKIIQVRLETNDAKTYVLEPLNDWKPEYKPGQFITLVFLTKHGEKRRSYSLSSSSHLKEPLSITVKKVENGEFSRWMLANLREGDELICSGISGFFVLPEKLGPQTDFCFLAAGSGIVPCFSLIKTLLATSANKILLIYSNRAREEAIYYQELQSLQQQYAGRFEIRFLFSVNNDIYYKRLSKWLLEQLLDHYLEEDLSHTLFYLCGPFEYMQTIEITLRIRVPRENIIKENFSTFPRLVLPEPPDKTAHQVTIHLNKQEYHLTVQYPDSILKAAKKRSIELPYSCEAGRCSSCVATCTKGKVWMAYNEVLVDKEVQKGRVLVCQSYPVDGEVEIVYDTI